MRLGAILGALPISGEGEATRVGWSEDGAAVIVETRDQTLRLLDGRRSEVWRYAGSPRQYAKVVANDQRIALLGPDASATLLDIEDGQVVAQLECAPTEAWSRDSTSAIGRGPDGTLRLWDTSMGAELRSLTVGEFTSVALSPDGKRMLLGREERVEIWDLVTSRCVRKYDDRLLALLNRRAISPDGMRVLAGCADGIIKLWDLASGLQIWSRDVGKHEPRSFAFSNDGRFALSSGSYGVIKIWDLSDGAEVSTFQVGSSWARKATFSPNGLEVLVACSESRFRRLALAEGAEVESVASHGGPDAVAFSSDGSRLFLALDDVQTLAFDAGGAGPVDTPTCMSSFASTREMESQDEDDLAFPLSDGRVLHWTDATDETDSSIWMEDPRSNKTTQPIHAQALSLAFSPRTPLVLAIPFWGGPLELWHAERGMLARLDLGNHEARRAAFSPDESAVAIATHAGDVLRIDLESL